MPWTTAFIGNKKKGGAVMQRKWLQETEIQRNEYAVVAGFSTISH